MYPGTITDRKGKLIVTTNTDELTQGFIVTDDNGVAVGIYIDDSTPNIEHWIELALQSNWKYKFVSIPMARAPHKWKGMINLLEWYPYHPGWVMPKRMPKYEGYILQYKFPGYAIIRWPKAKIKAPNFIQRKIILIKSLLKRPRFIFYY